MEWGAVGRCSHTMSTTALLVCSSWQIGEGTSGMILVDGKYNVAISAAPKGTRWVGRWNVARAGTGELLKHGMLGTTHKTAHEATKAAIGDALNALTQCEEMDAALARWKTQ